MKLWVKLTLAFVLVAVAGVALVAVLANRITTAGFRRYLLGEETTQLQSLQEALTQLYARDGSWNEANSVLRSSGLGGEGGYFLRLVDEEGNVVAARGGQGRGAGAFDPEQSLPIVVGDTQVGTLLAEQAGQSGRAGEQFLSSVNQAIVLAGLAAVLLALLLGLFLAQRMTRPLRALSEAAEAVAGGDLGQQVVVRGSDEVADLARHFNSMAAALAAAEVQRQQLLADTAHDLRTPISIIRSHLEAMLDGVFPATPENLAVLHEETLRLGRLVDDVRTLSLAESGALPLEREQVDVNLLVQQAVAAFAPLAEADGVVLEMEAGETSPVTVDVRRIQQVLANLLANALRYAAAGNGQPRVKVTVRPSPASVTVDIADNGPGLTVAQRSHVFDRFWRADEARSRKQTQGSGLGLAIAKGIVEAHGGSLSVSSEPGSGATFSFTLPLG